MAKKIFGAGVFLVGIVWLMVASNGPNKTGAPAPLGEALPSASSDSLPASSESPVQTAPANESAHPRSFAGDPCTQDCSGHEAGYNWAEAHDIDDEDACDQAGDDSNSPSFAEGCKAYVNGENLDENSDSSSDDGPN